MKSIELIDGVVGYRSELPTAWWTLHQGPETDWGTPQVTIANDEMFRLIAGQHIGNVSLKPLLAGERWWLQDYGFLWMIHIASGVVNFTIRDKEASANKVLLAGMGVLAGGGVSFDCEVVASGTAVFVNART